MKTKEAILKNVIESSSIRHFKDANNYLVDAEHAYKAMIDFAKQQSIAFMKFVDAQYNQQTSDVEYDKMYAQFIEQLSKQP